MCDDKDQELQDLKEFLRNLDFQEIDNKTIRIVPNIFLIEELPATVQEYLKSYFDYLDSIQ